MALQIPEPGVPRAGSCRSAIEPGRGQPDHLVRAGDGAAVHAAGQRSISALANWLGDTDDAVRLVTVRELLGGAPWFDTTLPRIGAPEPLVSHWSRLIDAPLAVLMLLFRPLLGVARRRDRHAHGVAGAAVLCPAADDLQEAFRRRGALGGGFRGGAAVAVGDAARAVQAGPHRPSQRADPMRRRRVDVPGAQPGGGAHRLDRWRADRPRPRRRLRGDRPGGAGARPGRRRRAVGGTWRWRRRARRHGCGGCTAGGPRYDRAAHRAGSSFIAMRCRSICRCSPVAARWACGPRSVCRTTWAPAGASGSRGCVRHSARCSMASWSRPA